MENQLETIKTKARLIRRLVLQSLHAAGSGHLGGSLGMADVFATLYFSFLKHNPENPSDPTRDRLILSNGHITPVHYATLATAGYFDEAELMTLRKLGSRLQGHPDKNHGLPGLELSAGSLGQGLSVAVGMALAAKMDGAQHRIICLMGDGELQEGSVWEAAMSATHHRLDNILAVVDRNYLQIDGNTEEVMALEPLKNKWEAFGWQVYECNGNDPADILQILKQFPTLNKPSVIIAQTHMGKGIPEIENDCRWHGKAPDSEEYRRFVSILENE